MHAQTCPTVCDPMDYSLLGSSVHGILQARILECIAIPFSRGSFWPRDRTWLSCTAGTFLTFWATRGTFTEGSAPSLTCKLSWSCLLRETWPHPNSFQLNGLALPLCSSYGPMHSPLPHTHLFSLPQIPSRDLSEQINSLIKERTWHAVHRAFCPWRSKLNKSNNICSLTVYASLLILQSLFWWQASKNFSITAISADFHSQRTST